MEAIKAILSTIEDIEPAQRGEMTLYSPSRNLRVMISTAVKITEQMKDEFEAKASELKPEIALFVSAVDDIDFDICNETSDGSHVLCVYVTREDLTPRFVRMLENMDPVDPAETAKTTKRPARPKAEKAPAKKSPIDDYSDDAEGFDKYCHEIVKSKIEFKKAQTKWPKEMKAYSTLAKFTEYIAKLKESKPTEEPTGTIEDFEDYIIKTPVSKITKTYLRSTFGNLSEALDLIESKNFRADVQDLKKSLTGKE